MTRLGMLDSIEKDDQALFEKIKGHPNPDPLMLWALSEEHFLGWRKIHDFPKLLNPFDKCLIHFKDWKKAYNFTNEEIIETGYLNPLARIRQRRTGLQSVPMVSQFASPS